MTRGREVLIVEDDEDVRLMLELVLEQHGYRTKSAVDGVEALERLSDGWRPSLILLDLRMPRMNGIELLNSLSGDASRASIPVVVLTGDIGAAPGALEAGARTCLFKPIDSSELLASVRAFAKPAQ